MGLVAISRAAVVEVAGSVVVRIVDHADEPKSDDAQPVNPDVKQLQDLYDLMRAESLENVELQDPDVRIRMQRGRPESSRRSSGHEPAHRSSHAPASSSQSESPAENGQAITTPLAGVFYRASSPSSNPYVNEGSVVDPGQTLCIVEAMKVMNEIKAETRCRILKILAENSRPVTAGQTLFMVEPA